MTTGLGVDVLQSTATVCTFIGRAEGFAVWDRHSWSFGPLRCRTLRDDSCRMILQSVILTVLLLACKDG
jgi:hypothetical protein